MHYFPIPSVCKLTDLLEVWHSQGRKCKHTSAFDVADVGFSCTADHHDHDVQNIGGGGKRDKMT